MTAVYFLKKKLHISLDHYYYKLDTDMTFKTDDILIRRVIMKCGENLGADSQSQWLGSCSRKLLSLCHLLSYTFVPGLMSVVVIVYVI